MARVGMTSLAALALLGAIGVLELADGTALMLGAAAYYIGLMSYLMME